MWKKNEGGDLIKMKPRSMLNNEILVVLVIILIVIILVTILVIVVLYCSFFFSTMAQTTRSRALLIAASAGAALGCLCTSLYLRRKFHIRKKSPLEKETAAGDDQTQLNTLLEFVNGPVCTAVSNSNSSQLLQFFHPFIYR